MLQPYLKPNLYQKLRIPIHSLDNRQKSRFSSDINSILQDLQEECGGTLKVINNISVAKDQTASPYQKRINIQETNYIIPMNKLQILEIQKKVSLESRLKDLILERKYRSKSIVEKIPLQMGGGFPYIAKKPKILNKSENHFDAQLSNIKESQNSIIKEKFNKAHLLIQNDGNQFESMSNSLEYNLNSTKCQSNEVSSESYFKSTQINPNNIDNNQIYKQPNQIQPIRSIKKIQPIEKLYSSIKKKGNKFGLSERTFMNDDSKSPGPAKYEVKRFGSDPYKIKSSLSAKEEIIPRSRIMIQLNKRILSFLPEIKNNISETLKEKFISQPIDIDPFIDKYGRNLYPLTSNNVPGPGPADYDSDLTCINKRVKKIKQDIHTKQEIQIWLASQSNIQTY